MSSNWRCFCDNRSFFVVAQALLECRCETPSLVVCWPAAAMANSSLRQCAAAVKREDVHCDKGFRKRFPDPADPVAVEWRSHYLFLNAAQSNCLDCVRYWVGQGASLQKGTMNNSGWTVWTFAEHGKAKDVLEYLRTLPAVASAPSAPESTSSGARASRDAGATSTRMSWNKIPPPPPLPPPAEEEEDEPEASVCFSEEADSLLWHAAMHGDMETLRQSSSGTACLELRPDFNDNLPQEMSSWTLREFLKLKQLCDSDATSCVQAVLAYISDLEKEVIATVLEKLSGSVPFKSNLSFKILSSLWRGEVVGHSNRESEALTRELWRKAFCAEVTTSAFEVCLQKEDIESHLFDTAWDANISHITSTRLWSLRMHAWAAHHWGNDSRLHDIHQLLCQAEEDAIGRIAQNIPQYDSAERRTVLKLLDLLDLETA